MNQFPYGGEVVDTLKISKDANKKRVSMHKRKMSLQFKHVLDDMNTAFIELSIKPNLATASNHMKSLSLFMIFIALLGLLLYEFK